MAKKNFGKRTLATLLSIIMIFSMVNISVLAAGEPQLVKNYEDTYYKQDGSAGTASDWEIHLSKQAAVTQTENVYDITLTVETKDTSVQLGGATHGAVTLVLDVSNSMDEAPDGCGVCGKSENHADHKGESNLCPDGSGNSYRRSLFGGNRCVNCDQRSNKHVQGEPVCRYEEPDTHLEELQDAVADFLDSYVENANDGDKRLVSVIVFGTDAATIQKWVDVTDDGARSDVEDLVNSLSTGNGAYLDREYLTNGGTNIEAGLVLARNLLNDTRALAGIPVENQSLILFSDGAPTARVNNVNSTSTDKVTYGGSDTGTKTDAADYDNIDDILEDISAATIAVLYNYRDSYNVMSDFDRVINSSADTLSVDLTGEAGKVVTTVTTPTIITDPMGEGVTLLGTNEYYEDGAWNLAGYTPTVSDGITSYTITYQVEIDPTVIDADPNYEGYTIFTPANGATTLDYTVGEEETPVEAQFNVPGIRGKLPKFTLTVNYVDEQGEAIADQIVETGILYGKEYSTEQKFIEGYTFEHMAQGSDVVSGIMDADKVVTYVYSKNPIPKYTVTYEYTGTVPAGAPAVPTQAEYEAGVQVTVAAAPELEGYTFSGWDKENFEMPAEDVTIKGSWTVKEQPPVDPPAPPAPVKYTVTYEYTGTVPAGAPAVPAQVEYEAGVQVTVAAAPELEGYTFSGWDKENFEMPAENVTIKGSWTKVEPPAPPATIYSVTYRYTGEIPEGAPEVPAVVKSAAGLEVILAAAAQMSGYTFSGWTTDDVTVEDGKFIMPEAHVVLEGSWTQLPPPPPAKGTLTITKTTNGLEDGDVLADDISFIIFKLEDNGVRVVDTVTYAQFENGTYTIQTEVGRYTVDELVYQMDGYRWRGRTIIYDKNGANEAAVVTANGTATVDITNNYDKMHDIIPQEKKYTVTYEYTGIVPVAAPGTPGMTQHVAGAEVSVEDAPTLKGYTFSGWTTNDVTVVGGKFTMPAGEVVFQGSWTRNGGGGGGIMSYPVTYSYTGAVPAGAPSAPALARYTAGTRVSVAAAPELEGYTFSGWTTDDVTVESGKFAMPAKRVELVGSWTRVELPVTPEVPETPEIPETPVDPVTPEVPETPVDPETPVQPDPVELPDEEPPLADLPEVDLPDEEPPLADLPEENVPLADVPKTGDLMQLHLLLAVLSGVGLVWLALSEKKRQNV